SDYFSDSNFLALRNLGFQDAWFFGSDFGGNLVGLQGKQSVTSIHKIARVFVPNGHDTAGDGFAYGWDLYFHTHVSGILCNRVAASNAFCSDGLRPPKNATVCDRRRMRRS